MKGGSNGCDCPPLSLFHRTFCLCRSNPQTKVSACVYVCVFTKRRHALCLQDMIYNHHSCLLLLAIVTHFLIVLITCKSVSVLGHLENGLNKCAFSTPYLCSSGFCHSSWPPIATGLVPTPTHPMNAATVGKFTLLVLLSTASPSHDSAWTGASQ